MLREKRFYSKQKRDNICAKNRLKSLNDLMSKEKFNIGKRRSVVSSIHVGLKQTKFMLRKTIKNGEEEEENKRKRKTE